MSEKRLICDELTVNYEGIFSVNELLKKIDEVTREKGYTKHEKKRKEKITAEGKEFSIELRPTKIKNDYYALMIKIRMAITNLTDEEITRDGYRMMMNKGKINMIFDAWTTTDYEKRWEKKPLFWFLRNMIERVTWKFHTDIFIGELDSDCHYIKEQIRAHLELHGLE